MTPHQQTQSWVLYESDANKEAPTVPPSAEKRKWQIVWRNVILFALLHIGGVYGAFLFLFKAMWATRIFGKFLFLNSLSNNTDSEFKMSSYQQIFS